MWSRSGQLIAHGSQRIPSAVCFHLRVLARPGVQIDPAGCAESLAVLTAKHELRHSQKPRLPYSRSHVQLRRICVERKHVRIIIAVFPFGRKNEMRIFAHFHINVFQASPARRGRLAGKVSAEVEPRGSCRGKPASDLDMIRGAHIAIFPHRIIRGEPTIDLRCLRLQLTFLKRHNKLLKIADFGGPEKPSDGKKRLYQFRLV